MPTLLLTAGKDKYVDNKGAREFFTNIKTPKEMKTIKLFYDCYHQIHKEPKKKAEYYTSVFEFIAKVLNKNDSSSLNWKMPASLQIGRPEEARKRCLKKLVLKVALVAYFAFGLLLWIFLKIFSKNRKLYPFRRVFLCWPLIFRAFFDMLKTKIITPKIF